MYGDPMLYSRNDRNIRALPSGAGWLWNLVNAGVSAEIAESGHRTPLARQLIKGRVSFYPRRLQLHF
jgi:hypothetical protein